MLLFILRCSLSTGRNVLRFNTSHVVIYLYNHAYFLVCKKFQYISCCYLSIQRPAVTPARIAFQYISCCYLSISGNTLFRILHRFNTSHVVIYRIRAVRPLAPKTSFNTSHVVIYPNIFQKRKAENQSFNTSHVVIYLSCHSYLFFLPCVSIHLMLLFILNGLFLESVYKSFNTSHVVIYL